MSNQNNEEKWAKIERLLRHMRRVEEGCEIIGKKLILEGKIDLGCSVIADGRRHDLGKLEEDNERDYLVFNKKCSKKKFKEVIREHQIKNSHHPECYGIDGLNYLFSSKNGEFCLIEMICDWRARSIDLGTDLREWIRKVATEKYNFKVGGPLYNKIMGYVDMLVQKSL